MIEGIIIAAKPDVTKQGNPYMVLTVASSPTEKHTINIWSSTPSDLKVEQAVQITAKEKDGFYSAALSDVKKIKPKQEWVNLLPKACSQQECFLVIESLISRYKECDNLKLQQDFTRELAKDCYEKYKKATAARTNHHNFIGGLLQHTYELLNMFNAIQLALPFKVDTFVVTISCLMHDYGKLAEYTQDFEYKPAFFLQGHPFLGAEAIGLIMRKYQFDYNIIQHVQHCILAHHGKLEYGSPVLPASPEAFIVAKMDELSGIGVQYDQPTGTKAMNTQIQRL